LIDDFELFFGLKIGSGELDRVLFFLQVAFNEAIISCEVQKLLEPPFTVLEEENFSLLLV
jgi:hypothetical protein